MPGKNYISLPSDGQQSLDYLLGEMVRVGSYLRGEVTSRPLSLTELKQAAPYDLAVAILLFVSDNPKPDNVSKGLSALIYMDSIKYPDKEIDDIVRSFGIQIGRSGIKLSQAIRADLFRAGKYVSPHVPATAPLYSQQPQPGF